MEDEKVKELTIKQRKFADFYIETGNATQSYIDAGYKATNRKVAEANARKLLANYLVKNYIEVRMEELQQNMIASQEEILQYLTRVMRGEEKDQFGLDASLKDRTDCAKLLGQKYGTFKEKFEVAGNIPVVITDDITE
nr:MAG TPA_asm: Terminase small subunit [Bacteriophage sp.]